MNELSWLATTATRVTAKGLVVIVIGALGLSVAAVLLGSSVAQRTDGPAPPNGGKNTWSSIRPLPVLVCFYSVRNCRVS